MSLVEAGTVTSVDTKQIGSPVVGAAVAGDLSVFVNDNVDFTPGDQVLITPPDVDGQLYYVDSVDDEEGITLTTPLMDDAPEGTWVATYPLQQETRATVRLAESGEVRECVVLHTLSDALRPGIRDESTSENVLTVLVDDVRYVFDIIARQTIRDISEALPGVPPAKPDIPVLSTLAYLDSMKQLRAQITATWSPVTTNADGSDIGDLDHYEVQTSTAGGDWQTYTSTPGDITQAFIRPLEPGSAWSVRVRAVDTSKNAGEWSDAATITAATDDVPPSQPSRPTLTSRLGVITITWDGKNSTGGAMEADLAYVEVHLSTTSGFTTSAATKVDQIPRAASVVWGPATFGTTYYVKFVAVDTSGNSSSESLQQSTAVAPLVDISNFPDDAMNTLYARTAHFITLDADQVTANSAAIGFLETGVIVGGAFEASGGGEFRTNATPTSGGIRIRDADGFMAWANGGGTPTVTIDRTTGLLTARNASFPGGNVTAGSFSTAASGQRVVIDSSNIAKFYDSGGTQRGTIAGLSTGIRITGAGSAFVQIATTGVGIAGNTSMDSFNTAGDGTMGGNLNMGFFAINQVGALNSGGGDIPMSATIKPNECYLTSLPASSGGTDVQMGASGRLFKVSPSAKRYKKNITALDIDPAAILAVEPVSFEYRKNAPTDATGRHVGFIADQLDELGLTDFVLYGDDDQVENAQYRLWVVALQVAVRHLYSLIQAGETDG